MTVRASLRCLVAALLAVGAIATEAEAQAPRFRADGPDAVAYGLNEGYPTCTGLKYIDDTRCRVGVFSNYGALFPSRDIAAPAAASPLKRAMQEPELRYTYNGKERTLDDYLNIQPVTGLLIARDDTILIERYQYGRTDKQLLTSFSMAKSVVGLLIGIALEEGAIKSIDDTAESYVSELKGSEYGRTPIKALLQMASGVAFSEIYSDITSDIYMLSRMTLQQQDPAGCVAAVKRFNKREAPPGERYSYSSAESTVLGLVLARVTGRTVSEYTSEKLWQPLGAEAGAKWNIDAAGQEVTYAHFNAVLRDWARLGLMLAHRGQWAGRRVVPEAWIKASTSVGPDSPSPTYGYHIWISATDRNRFFFRGLRGQFVIVDPVTRTVLVQTSLASNEAQFQELFALFAVVQAQVR